jgi:hypothetical protein
MPTSHVAPKTIDEYISDFSPEVQAVLQRVRPCAAPLPGAPETISYRIPAFKLNGMLVYFAAFTKHIGLSRLTANEPELRARHAEPRDERSFARSTADQAMAVCFMKRSAQCLVTNSATKTST